jgi:hypothetical protein
MILVFGVLLFNEIFVIPACGFNLYTKEKLEEATVESTERDDE